MKEYGLMLLNTKKGGFVQKFTTIDGTEYDLKEIQEKAGKNELKEFLEALANATN